jgi:hypothetical protein
MPFRTCIAFLVILPAAILAQKNNVDPIVNLGYARFRGVHNATTGINTFYGIPFAEPPVGRLRWKAPRPIATSANAMQTVENATTPGPSCVQGVPYWTNPNPNPNRPSGRENCLILNIFSPANMTRRSKLPVLVTIHGGGYTTGDANTGDPHALLRHSNNAFVFVSIQYRLGAYGFIGSKRFECRTPRPKTFARMDSCTRSRIWRRCGKGFADRRISRRRQYHKSDDSTRGCQESPISSRDCGVSVLATALKRSTTGATVQLSPGSI